MNLHAHTAEKNHVGDANDKARESQSDRYARLISDSAQGI